MIGSRMNSPPGCRYSILLSCMQLLCPFLSLPTLSRLLPILSDGFDPFKTHLYGKSHPRARGVIFLDPTHKTPL
jgi:hypothetical protein